MFPRVVGAFVAVAVGSASPAPAAEPITLTAEAVEVVKLKPDVAKIYLNVETKDASAEEAAKANADARKKLVDAVEKAGSKGLKTAALQQKITKDRDNSNRVFRAVGPGGPVVQPPPAESYTVNQPMVFTVTDADPEKLLGVVEKVLQAAAGVGVTGESNSNDYRYSPYGETRSGGRVVYEVKGGWDGPVSDALARATARALKHTHAMAKGAEVRVVKVLTVEDVSEGPVSGAADVGPRGFAVSDEPVSDGIELTRRVKVRVKVTAE